MNPVAFAGLGPIHLFKTLKTNRMFQFCHLRIMCQEEIGAHLYGRPQRAPYPGGRPQERPEQYQVLAGDSDL